MEDINISWFGTDGKCFEKFFGGEGWVLLCAAMCVLRNFLVLT